MKTWHPIWVLAVGYLETRKPHKCSLCEKLIPVGSECCYSYSNDEYFHLECKGVREMLSDTFGVDLLEDRQRRGCG